jgi:hypothetical protein
MTCRQAVQCAARGGRTGVDESFLLDRRRLGPEMIRALKGAGPGASVADLGDLVPTLDVDRVVFVRRGDGAFVLSVALYRLRGVDLDLVSELALEVIDAMPSDRAAQILEAIYERADWGVEAPPDEDLVYIEVAGRPLCGIHRSLVVKGWPSLAEGAAGA